MTTVEGQRTQWAAGEGAFHTARLRFDSEADRHFVYDCGAQPPYQTGLEAEIDSYLASIPSEARITVYLSHLHLDHVSGLERLLRSRRVAEVVMPLTPLAERLIVLAAAASSAPTASAVPRWYVRFIAGPAAWIAELDESVAVTELAAPEGPFQADDGFSGIAPGGGTSTGDATVTFGPSRGRCYWVIAPWVLSGARGGRTRFLDWLVHLCWPEFASTQDLQSKLTNPVKTVAFATSYQRELTLAYRRVFRDLNLTSLHLYSGPVTGAHWGHRHATPAPELKRRARYSRRVGWVGTGDAPLKSGVRSREFEAVLGPVSRWVGAMQLPHHGSDASLDPRLVHTVPHGTVFIASADRYSTWRHPGPVTARAASAAGTLVIVTSDVRSRWTETFTCWW